MTPPDSTSTSAERARLTRGLRKELERRLWMVGELRVDAPREPSNVQKALDRPTDGEAVAPAPADRAPRAVSAAQSGGPAPTAPEPGPSRPGSSSSDATGERSAPAPTVESQLALATSAPDLDALRAQVAACRACSLCETRTQTVFADGTGPARVLFIGEAPGQREDEQGVPFVGPAGQLLTDIIEKGMGLPRSDVVIANVLKCRPPGNRDPEPAEKALCTPFLDRQIELYDPEVLITLGAHASKHILQTTDSMGRLRGRVHTRAGRKVIATYHPAYLLRSPSMKSACWEDIQLAMKELGLPLPGKR